MKTLDIPVPHLHFFFLNIHTYIYKYINIYLPAGYYFAQLNTHFLSNFQQPTGGVWEESLKKDALISCSSYRRNLISASDENLKMCRKCIGIIKPQFIQPQADAAETAGRETGKHSNTGSNSQLPVT